MSVDQTILFAFPGQGAQYPGIGKDLYDAYDSVRNTYKEASDILAYDMASLSFSDPENKINLTRYTQPVLVTHHVACMRLFKELSNDSIQPTYAAGHSLGEYSALLCAGSIDFKQALSMVSERGNLMGQYGQGEMEALTLGYEEARTLADEYYCGVAALNLTDQTVVGGLPDDLQALAEAMKERFPRKRSTRLKTEGAFHTYHMVEAAKRFRKVLDANNFDAPAIDVCSNYTGSFHAAKPASIRSRLFMQLFNPVLWHNNLNHVVDQGVNLIIEFGGGIGKGESAADKHPNLEGIVKKTFRRHESPPRHLAVINIESLEKALSEV
jgi:[acyl-carrier-protein] S-malonyltransferase